MKKIEIFLTQAIEGDFIAKYEELKSLICCKKQIEEENYLEDEYQMEIL